ncbi:MAG: metallophosphoesterase family protein [Nanobdellota archaeon]
MKFIHFADCHLDGYREKKLSDISLKNVTYIIDTALDRNVDFVLLAGDLFNTALPRVDVLKFAVEQFRRLAEKNIPVYTIAGSHDFSPRGKTMLDVLEKAGLICNVVKGSISDESKLRLQLTRDEKTGVLVTGLLGKKGMVDKEFYKDIDREQLSQELREQNSFSIFMFHTAISELKPKGLENMDSAPASFLPEGFDYYAGGHVHITSRYSSKEYSAIVYPGPTFPNNFSELEKLGSGTFVYYDNNQEFQTEQGTSHFRHETIPSVQTQPVQVDITGSAFKAVDKIITTLQEYTLSQKIVLLRLEGIITEGKTSDIDFNEVLKYCYDQGSYIVLKNMSKLKNTLFEEVVVENEDSGKIQESTIKEHLGSIELPSYIDEKGFIKQLLQHLDQTQGDGETKHSFSQRIIQEVNAILEKERNENK